MTSRSSKKKNDEGWLSDDDDKTIYCSRMPEKFVFEDGFADTLFKYIDKHGLTNAQAPPSTSTKSI